MNSFSTDELSRMQATQASAMQDTCVLLIRTATANDSHGMPVVRFEARSTVACGLDNRASREMLNAEAHVFDARLRLPLGTAISNADRVRITHRFGVLLVPPVEYEILGEARRGPSGLVLNLRSM